MYKFKIGDKVLRHASVCDDMVDHTGVQKGGVYTVRAVSNSGMSIRLDECKEPGFNFASIAFSPATSSSNWDINEAKRLRKEAELAVKLYNQYIQKQPKLDPINIK